MFTRGGRRRLGALRGTVAYDLARAVPAWRSIDNLLRLPVERIRSRLAGIDWDAYRLDASSLVRSPPIGRQEVWAAGVTYMRSREARVEETATPDIYERVYEAPRPELFFKASASRTVGAGEPVGVRADSVWDVPEPELVLVLNRQIEIVGYTIGNDMSSRSIEGENPLYLPQAKIFERCFALGPAITPAWDLCPDDLSIRMTVARGTATVFSGEVSTRQFKRTLPDLIRALAHSNTFEFGVFLSTGTGIVPPADFTLAAGDQIVIEIDGIGRLSNPVVRLAGPAA